MKAPQIVRFALIAGLLLLPTAGAAQSSSGTIAGVAKDTSGAVLPGVTVEVASPALIEKVRSSVTDASGVYQITSLRPGTYTVSFSLAGFSTVKREGLELSAGFTATVNGELRVGTLSETITVSGASPVVDTQSARTQSVLSRETLDVLPTAKNFQGLAALTVGATGQSRETGGDRGESLFGIGIHNAGAGLPMIDGMSFGGTYGSVHRFAVNQLAVQEAVLETSGGSASSESGGLNVNIISKDGGNRFTAAFETEGTNKSFQSSNLTDELRKRGLVQPNRTKSIYEVSGAFGGPIKRDKLWFFTATRFQGAKAEIAGVYFNKPELRSTLFYEPDLSNPAYSDNHTRDHLLRLTWQASPKNKFNFLADVQHWCWCYYYIDQSRVGFADQSRGFHVPESTYHMEIDPNDVFQATWTFPATNRLLFEAGVGKRDDRDIKERPAETSATARPVLELSTNTAYGSMFAGSAQWLDDYGDQYNNLALMQRAAVSYISGSHALKVGFNNLSGDRPAGGRPNYNVGYEFLNRVPVALDQVAAPHYQLAKLKYALGLYAQDQWSLKRLTLNIGLRYDALNMYHPEQTRPAGEFTPEYHFAAVYNLPNWKDISPRIGGAFDLFGNGKTAIKGSLGRYPILTYSPGVSANTNPSRAIAGTTARTWNDANGNYVPDCDLKNRAGNGECGPMNNQAFGTPTPVLRYALDASEGWSRRQYTWQGSVALQHELRPGVGVTAAYFRTAYHQFNVTDNELVTPADFDPFCITAPSDPRLQGGGGYQICGLYNVKPAKFGLVNNVITQAENFGNQSNVFNGLDVTLNARFRGAILSAGVATGQTVADNCAVADAPAQFCRTTNPFSAQTQIKINGAYPLPWWGLQASAVYQNLPGIQQSATIFVPNSQIVGSLGRNLAACGAAVVCNAIVAARGDVPFTLFEPRSNQIDVRLTKTIRAGRVRMSPRFDVYNLFNNSAVTRLNPTFGAVWLKPLDVLGGRLVKFGAHIDF